MSETKTYFSLKSMLRYLAIFFVLFVGFVIISTDASAATKKSLLKKVKAKTSYSITKTYYSDFDGDGKKELFAVAERDHHYKIYFASSKQVKKILDVYNMYLNTNAYKVSGKQRVFIATHSSMSWGYTSAYYVKNGKVKTAAINDGKSYLHAAYYSMKQVSGKIFLGAYKTSYNPNGWGTTFGTTYFRWTGSKFVRK